MSAPATPVSPTPAARPPTHACARCGAPVPLDVGLCERCNPLGLRDSASSQAHGTVFVGIAGAVVALVIFARLAVSGIGPFSAQVTAIKAGDAPGSVVATLSVHNDGKTAGSATCRVTDPADTALLHTFLVYSARIEPGATAVWDQTLDFGTPGRPLAIACKGP
jgi:ribosomal protein L40E